MMEYEGKEFENLKFNEEIMEDKFFLIARLETVICEEQIFGMPWDIKLILIRIN